jgi:hypothetical protein
MLCVCAAGLACRRRAAKNGHAIAMQETVEARGGQQQLGLPLLHDMSLNAGAGASAPAHPRPQPRPGRGHCATAALLCFFLVWAPLLIVASMLLPASWEAMDSGSALHGP